MPGMNGKNSSRAVRDLKDELLTGSRFMQGRLRSLKDAYGDIILELQWGSGINKFNPSMTSEKISIAKTAYISVDRASEAIADIECALRLAPTDFSLKKQST
jgi:hypothetical protein